MVQFVFHYIHIYLDNLKILEMSCSYPIIVVANYLFGLVKG
jgi:hypothetical protein